MERDTLAQDKGRHGLQDTWGWWETCANNQGLGEMSDRWNKMKGKWPETRGELDFKIKQEAHETKTQDKTKPVWQEELLDWVLVFRVFALLGNLSSVICHCFWVHQKWGGDGIACYPGLLLHGICKMWKAWVVTRCIQLINNNPTPSAHDSVW